MSLCHPISDSHLIIQKSHSLWLYLIANQIFWMIKCEQKSPEISGSFAENDLRLNDSATLYLIRIWWFRNCIHSDCIWFGVAPMSRLLKIIGLFCNRALWKRLYSAKETCHFKEPTNRSHPIANEIQPVPEKTRLQMVIRMPNEILDGHHRTLFERRIWKEIWTLTIQDFDLHFDEHFDEHFESRLLGIRLISKC